MLVSRGKGVSETNQRERNKQIAEQSRNNGEDNCLIKNTTECKTNCNRHCDDHCPVWVLYLGYAAENQEDTNFSGEGKLGV